MASRQLPDAATLRKLLRYDPDTGNLYWRERTPDMFPESGYGGAAAQCQRWNSRNAGKEGGIISARGYRVVKLFGHPFLAHRIVLTMATGVHVTGQVDHINGDPKDNRLTNLRVVAAVDNARNRRRSAANKSGHMGISYVASSQKWKATIGLAGREVYLGTFQTFEEAKFARLAAEAKYQFHPNHGRMVDWPTAHSRKQRKSQT